ncbi:hypothetical protein BK133_30205, partial [Paenibacillus sp. FSL H8-0548]
DMKDLEIAAVLQENVNTIKSRLYKARMKLKNLLQHESGGAVLSKETNMKKTKKRVINGFE